MAQRPASTVTNERSGSTEEMETVRFSLDGIAYQIELSSDEACQLREVFSHWAKRASRVRLETPPRGPQLRGASRAQQIRGWAKVNGYSIPSRGRIPDWLVMAYENSMQSSSE
ncbi:histone-like nucleoid-structuring protein Lsr2 [Nocardia aurantiaca]